MKRREFLIAAATAAAAGGILPADGHSDPEITDRPVGPKPEVIVVGAGAMGGWTALALAEAGASVTLVDAYGPGNLRAASSDQSRLIRADYDNPLYARMAIESHVRLTERQRQWGETLLIPTGQILFAGVDRNAELDRLEETLSIVGVAGVERLGVPELRRRWPQLDFDGIDSGLFTPGGPGASTILAERTTRRVAKAVQAAGGRIVLGQASAPTSVGGRLVVPLSSGDRLEGDIAVYACGAWMSNLFPEMIARHVEVERRDVFYFGTPPGDARFSHPHLPAWDLVGSGFYGFPDFDGGGFKIAPYPDRNSIDPDRDDRRPNDYVAERARGFLRRRFPALGDQPLLFGRVCQVAHTKTEDFIIDRHPGVEGVWLIGGDSGHAFKHGSAIGADMARRILTGAGDPGYAAAFRVPD